MEIKMIGMWDDGLALLFNNDAQFLYYKKQFNCYVVLWNGDVSKENIVNVKIVPCEKEDVKEGDFVLFGDIEEKDLTDKQNFKLVVKVNEERFSFVNICKYDEGIEIGQFKFDQIVSFNRIIEA